MRLQIRHSCLQKHKFYTENLASKVLKLVNEDFCKLIYEQFKHVQLVVSLTFRYVCTCYYTQLLITEIMTCAWAYLFFTVTAMLKILRGTRSVYKVVVRKPQGKKLLGLIP